MPGMMSILVPAILLPAAFAGGWFAMGMVPKSEPPPPEGPRFVDVGTVHLSTHTDAGIIPLHVGLTIDPAVAGGFTNARLRDSSLTLLTQAVEIPLLTTAPDFGPDRLMEAIRLFAPEWILHMRLVRAEPEAPPPEMTAETPAEQLRSEE